MSGTRDIEITSLSAIEHVVLHCPKRIRMLRVAARADGRLSALMQDARRAGIAVDTSLSKGRDEGALALLHPYDYTELHTVLENVADKKHSILLALDHLQDPQNLGALCRSAEGLGLDAVILPKDRSVTVNGGAYNASVGAVETLPVCLITNLGETLRKLKEQGYWIVGSTLGEGASGPDDMPSFEKIVLVLGSELEGLAPGIQKLCDWQLTIPLSGKVQSLNVSAAGAILMYELLRRQRQPN